MCISNIYIYSINKGLRIHTFAECLNTKVWKMRNIRNGRELANLHSLEMGKAAHLREDILSLKRASLHPMVQCRPCTWEAYD
jgi:hypothetical protein